MYIITHKQKPATLEKLFTLNNDHFVGGEDSRRYESIIAHRTRAGAIALYLYYFGFTWAERPAGVEAVQS